jgi:NADH:ubiquinone oxidoreductase subunit 3 (subunit A)
VDTGLQCMESLGEVQVVANGYLIAAIFFLGGCAFVLGGLAFADVLNAILLNRRPAKDKLTTYESGETPIGSAWVQYPLAFYIFALLFVAFDVDIVFLISWAVIFQQLGLFGYIEIVFFIVTLALGLVYAWRKGVIRWI